MTRSRFILRCAVLGAVVVGAVEGWKWLVG